MKMTTLIPQDHHRFTVPVDEWWLSIPDVDGKIHEIKPVLDKFELTAECTNCSAATRDVNYDLLAEDGKCRLINH